jgi:hypothetical protein
MSGVRLLTLDSADLLDVLHYMFEKDLMVASSEESDAKDRLRSAIYENLYGRPYDYGSSIANQLPLGMVPEDHYPLEDEDIVPFDPLTKSRPTKAYTPTTKFNPAAANPYHGVLDAPMG